LDVVANGGVGSRQWFGEERATQKNG
jgi:hypothetical protein